MTVKIIVVIFVTENLMEKGNILSRMVVIMLGNIVMEKKMVKGFIHGLMETTM